jgi:hypothetical protein
MGGSRSGLPPACCGVGWRAAVNLTLAQSSQFSTFKLDTRLNSATFAVAQTARSVRACVAINRSFAPMGVPVSRASLGSPCTHDRCPARAAAPRLHPRRRRFGASISSSRASPRRSAAHRQRQIRPATRRCGWRIRSDRILVSSMYERAAISDVHGFWSWRSIDGKASSSGRSLASTGQRRSSCQWLQYETTSFLPQNRLPAGSSSTRGIRTA